MIATNQRQVIDEGLASCIKLVILVLWLSASLSLISSICIGIVLCSTESN